MSLLEKIILSLAAAIAVAGTIISHVAPSYFAERFVVEDGFIEWLTVIALVASAILMLRRAWTLKGVRSPLFLFVTVMAAAEKLAPGTELADRIAAPRFQKERLQIGMEIPDIRGEDMDGVPFALSDYRGKVVVLDFWGFW